MSRQMVSDKPVRKAKSSGLPSTSTSEAQARKDASDMASKLGEIIKGLSEQEEGQPPAKKRKAAATSPSDKLLDKASKAEKDKGGKKMKIKPEAGLGDRPPSRAETSGQSPDHQDMNLEKALKSDESEAESVAGYLQAVRAEKAKFITQHRLKPAVGIERTAEEQKKLDAEIEENERAGGMKIIVIPTGPQASNRLPRPWGNASGPTGSPLLSDLPPLVSLDDESIYRVCKIATGTAPSVERAFCLIPFDIFQCQKLLRYLDARSGIRWNLISRKHMEKQLDQIREKYPLVQRYAKMRHADFESKRAKKGTEPKNGLHAHNALNPYFIEDDQDWWWRFPFRNPASTANEPYYGVEEQQLPPVIVAYLSRILQPVYYAVRDAAESIMVEERQLYCSQTARQRSIRCARAVAQAKDEAKKAFSVYSDIYYIQDDIRHRAFYEVFGEFTYAWVDGILEPVDRPPGSQESMPMYESNIQSIQSYFSHAIRVADMERTRTLYEHDLRTIETCAPLTAKITSEEELTAADVLSIGPRLLDIKAGYLRDSAPPPEEFDEVLNAVLERARTLQDERNAGATDLSYRDGNALQHIVASDRNLDMDDVERRNQVAVLREQMGYGEGRW